MKDRAHRFLAVYVVLLFGLAVTRYATHQTYPKLLELEDQQSRLLHQRDELTREIDGLESVRRVREWATKHGMVPYTVVPHETRPFSPLSEPPATPATKKVTLSTEWR